jgi:hypothetical protein
VDNEFYTYVHIRQDNGQVFYVGKGKGNRVVSLNKRNLHWQNIAKKHGVLSKIMFRGLSEKSSFETERFLVAICKSIGLRLANKTDGGEGPSGMKHSDATKKKWSDAKLGKKRGKYSPEHCRKISESLKGKVVSQETRLKISQATKAAMQSPEIRQKLIDAKLGKPRPKHSESTKLKMSISAKARWANQGETNAP